MQSFGMHMLLFAGFHLYWLFPLKSCQKALKQIADKGYEEALKDDGMENILRYGIACYKKRCRVVMTV